MHIFVHRPCDIFCNLNQQEKRFSTTQLFYFQRTTDSLFIIKLHGPHTLMHENKNSHVVNVAVK